MQAFRGETFFAAAGKTRFIRSRQVLAPPIELLLLVLPLSAMDDRTPRVCPEAS